MGVCVVGVSTVYANIEEVCSALEQTSTGDPPSWMSRPQGHMQDSRHEERWPPTGTRASRGDSGTVVSRVRDAFRVEPGEDKEKVHFDPNALPPLNFPGSTLSDRLRAASLRQQALERMQNQSEESRQRTEQQVMRELHSAGGDWRRGAERENPTRQLPPPASFSKFTSPPDHHYSPTVVPRVATSLAQLAGDSSRESTTTSSPHLQQPTMPLSQLSAVTPPRPGPNRRPAVSPHEEPTHLSPANTSFGLSTEFPGLSAFDIRKTVSYYQQQLSRDGSDTRQSQAKATSLRTGVLPSNQEAAPSSQLTGNSSRGVAQPWQAPVLDSPPESPPHSSLATTVSSMYKSYARSSSPASPPTLDTSPPTALHHHRAKPYQASLYVSSPSSTPDKELRAAASPPPPQVIPISHRGSSGGGDSPEKVPPQADLPGPQVDQGSSEEEDYDVDHSFHEHSQSMKIWQIVRAMLVELEGDDIHPSLLVQREKLRKLLEVHTSLFEEEQTLSMIEFGLLREQHMYMHKLRVLERLGCSRRWGEDPSLMDPEDAFVLQQLRHILYAGDENFELVDCIPEP